MRYPGPYVLLALALPAFSQTLPSGVAKKATLAGITEYSYPNGLRVLLFPDPSSPKVTVSMTYLVGSRFEGYGETGMAHLLSHMNFIRSTHDREIKKEITSHGAAWNVSYDYDFTNYYETVTASNENLQWALGLEAERMVNMRMEKALLDTEMTVVRNEFELGENYPDEILEQRVAATAYLWHNYGKAPIGSRADIEKVPIDRLAAFYSKYYQPDNAVLLIAGQFDDFKALAMTASTLGAIPRPTRKLEEPYTEEPVQDGERTVELRRVGTNPLLGGMWHAPALSHSDSAALLVLDGILAGGNGTGRLYKVLVDGKKATAVRIEYEQLRDPGFIYVQVTLSKDQSLEDARKAMLDTIAGVATDAPSKDEVERAKAKIVQGMERAMANPQQAALGLREMIAAGDWRLYFVHYDDLAKVTPEDVVRVAKLYFKESNRTIGEFIPEDKPDRTNVPAAPDLTAGLRDYKTTFSISAGESFDPTPGNIEKHLTRVKLPDGAKLTMLPKTARDTAVTVRLRLQFGDEKSLAGQEAVGTLARALLIRGTKTKTRQQLQDEMTNLNAAIGVGPGGGVGAATVNIRTTQEHLIPALRLAVEILREPAFPPAEFDQVRKQQIAAFENQRTNPASLAARALERSMNHYPRGDVRYIPTIDEQIEDLNQVTLDGVKQFQQKFYGASNAEAVVVGQFDPAEVRKALMELVGA